jgi:hypothetical protein
VFSFGEDLQDEEEAGTRKKIVDQKNNKACKQKGDKK